MPPLYHDSMGGDTGSGASQSESRPKEESNFQLSGALFAENLEEKGRAGAIIDESSDAAVPTKPWRLYEFKGDDIVRTYYFGGKQGAGQRFLLFGRDGSCCDVICAHPSVSKQHCCIQFRKVQPTKDALPYLMDLNSGNGTFLNREKKPIARQRYIELRAQDVVTVGFSSREYVLIVEK
jgi:hypothetical protein